MYRIETYKGIIKYIPKVQLKQEIERYEGTVENLPNQGYTFTNDGKTAIALKCLPTNRIYYGRKEKQIQICEWIDPITKKIEDKWDDKNFLPMPDDTMPNAIKILSDMFFEGVQIEHLRHFWNADLKYEEMNDGPALKLKRTIGKTGKIVRRLMPTETHDKVIQELATTINIHNEFFLRKKELLNFQILSGLEGAEQGEKLGSCMFGHNTWKNVDLFTFDSPTDVDLSAPPPPNCGPYTILWNGITDKKLTQGFKNIRAFLWPVEIDGNREWYIDRIYPASGDITIKWMEEWAEAMGMAHTTKVHYGIATSQDNKTHKSGVAMIHNLKKKLHFNNPMPWLDTMSRTSKNLKALITSEAIQLVGCGGTNARSTSGSWR